MHLGIGSRGRFLFRVILYSFALVAGLYVFSSQSNSPQGHLLGLIGVGAGMLSLFLLFRRLRDPWSAIQYALQPVVRVSQLIEQWQRNARYADWAEQQESLRLFLAEALPDVEMKDRHASDRKQTALAVGEELLVYVCPSLTTPEDVEALLQVVTELRTPLHEEHVLILLGARTDLVAQADVMKRLRRACVLILRS